MLLALFMLLHQLVPVGHPPSGGQLVELVTVGYVSHALGRTTWTVRSWQRMGLFPRAPFVVHQRTHPEHGLIALLHQPKLHEH